jgi:GAF domain-containing protein
MTYVDGRRWHEADVAPVMIIADQAGDPLSFALAYLEPSA